MIRKIISTREVLTEHESRMCGVDRVAVHRLPRSTINIANFVEGDSNFTFGHDVPKSNRVHHVPQRHNMLIKADAD